MLFPLVINFVSQQIQLAVNIHIGMSKITAIQSEFQKFWDNNIGVTSSQELFIQFCLLIAGSNSLPFPYAPRSMDSISRSNYCKKGFVGGEPQSYQEKNNVGDDTQHLYCNAFPQLTKLTSSG